MIKEMAKSPAQSGSSEKSVGRCRSGEAEKEQLQRTCKGSSSGSEGLQGEVPTQPCEERGFLPRPRFRRAHRSLPLRSLFVVLFRSCGKFFESVISKWELWETLKLNWTFQDRL